LIAEYLTYIERTSADRHNGGATMPEKIKIDIAVEASDFPAMLKASLDKTESLLATLQHPSMVSGFLNPSLDCPLLVFMR
jgi:hypothetical protein